MNEANADALKTTATTLREYVKVIKRWHELPMAEQVMLQNDLERDLGALADWLEGGGK